MYPTRESNTQSVVAVQQNDVILVSDRRFVSNVEKLAAREAKVQSWGEWGTSGRNAPRRNLRPLSDAPFPTGMHLNYWASAKSRLFH
jgi:hypothetical protein